MPTITKKQMEEYEQLRRDKESEIREELANEQGFGPAFSISHIDFVRAPEYNFTVDFELWER